MIVTAPEAGFPGASVAADDGQVLAAQLRGHHVLDVAADVEVRSVGVGPRLHGQARCLPARPTPGPSDGRLMSRAPNVDVEDTHRTPGRDIARDGSGTERASPECRRSAL